MRRNEPRFLRLREGLDEPHPNRLLAYASLGILMISAVMIGHIGLRAALILRETLHPQACALVIDAAAIPECL